MQPLHISIILPVRRDALRLNRAVAACLALSATTHATYEIIIVNDASDRETTRLTDRLVTTHANVAVLRYTRRNGYRRALHDAWSAASGQYILALDLSGPANASDIPRLLQAIPDHSVVLGYRETAPYRLNDLVLRLTTRRIAPAVRDPALGLALFRADQRDLLDPTAPDSLTHTVAYATAQERGRNATQVSVNSHYAINANHGGGILGVGMLIAAGSLWLLRRILRQP